MNVDLLKQATGKIKRMTAKEYEGHLIDHELSTTGGSPTSLGYLPAPRTRYIGQRESLSKKKGKSWLGGKRPMTTEELLGEAKRTDHPYRLRAIHDALVGQGHEGISARVPKGYRGALSTPDDLMLPGIGAVALSSAGHGLHRLAGWSAGTGGPLRGMEAVVRRLRKDGVRVEVAPNVAAHFSPSGRVVRVATSDHPAVLAHEAGHALASSGGMLRRAISKADVIGRVGGPLAAGAMAMAAPWASDVSLQEDKKKAARRLRRYRNALIGASAVNLPMLVEEAVATGKGMQLLRKTHGTSEALKGGLRLAPAYGTYLAGAAMPLLGAHLVNKKLKKLRGKKRVGDAKS